MVDGTEYEDEAFGEIEKAMQRKVATGVTDGTINAHQIINDLVEALRAASKGRDEVLEEVAEEIEKFTFAFGVDTVQSFAAFVRGMKG